MFNLNDQAVRGGCFCLSKAGLAIGTDTATAKIAAPNGAGISYVVDGLLYHQDSEDDSTIVLTGDVQTAKYTNIYLVSINADGDILVTQGTEVLTVDLEAGKTQLYWPALTAGYAPIGAVEVDAGSGAFTPGTTTLSGGSVTITYWDLFSLPVQPIGS